MGHVRTQPGPATSPSSFFSIFFFSLQLDISHWAGPFLFPPSPLIQNGITHLNEIEYCCSLQNVIKQNPLSQNL
jgi:hypothetical protein